MLPEIVYDDDEIRVIHQPGSSRFSLVTFGAIGHRVDGTHFWAEAPARSLGLDAIGILAHRPNWYPQAAMRRAAPAILARLHPRRIGYGFSMGGYGALKHGRLLGLTHVLAASPQASIDPADMPGDHRYVRYFDPDRQAGMRVAAGDMAPFAVQVVDPYKPLDLAHARGIAGAGPVWTLNLPFMNHGTASLFASTAMLAGTLDLLLAGNLPGLRLLMRQRRGNSRHWMRLVGIAAYERGHYRVAEALWDRAASLGTDPALARQDRARALAGHAEWLFRRGGPGASERALATALAAATLLPADASLLFTLGTLLSRHGLPEPALVLRRRAALLSPDLPYSHLVVAETLLLLDRRAEAVAALRQGACRLPQDELIAAQLRHWQDAA